MPHKQASQARPKTSVPNIRTKMDVDSVTSIEFQSFKDIIVALNQKLIKTEDLELELLELRSCMLNSNDGRA